MTLVKCLLRTPKLRDSSCKQFIANLLTPRLILSVMSPFLSSLLTSYRTALAMGNTEDEKAGTATPMGKTS